MAKIFVTGSADGLGQLAAKELVFLGHQVVLHARSETRAIEARRGVPGAQGALVGDLSSIKQTIQLAASANEFGHFDAVIHNAGVYQVSASQLSEDGFPMLLAVNVFAPYILTCLMHKPRRMI
ncbi:3-ketoacyl-(acyl-carrier-protein) reductase [compost metagenome]